MSTVAERVAAGAAFLDERDPEWWRADVERAIDLETLDLSLGQTCILGQRCPLEMRDPSHVYTDYHMLASHLAAVAVGLEATVDRWAGRLGFQVDSTADWDDVSGSLDEFDELTAEWKRIITGRRAAS